MKYYGKFNDEHDLITVAKGEEIAQDVVENYHDSTKQNNIIFSSSQPSVSGLTTGDLWVEDISPDYLCFTAVTANSTFTCPQAFDISTNDGTTWAPYSSTITLANIGDKALIRKGNVALPTGESGFGTFTMTGSIAASGSIMSLVDNTVQSLTIPSVSHIFKNLFENCVSLTTPPRLPATTLYTRCYNNLFKGCTSLTIAPELPALSIPEGAYACMFWGCTSLLETPELPANSIDEMSYYAMFLGCTSITTPPNLPCTVLNCMSSYSSMFWGCTSLHIADAATTGYSREWRIPTNGVVIDGHTYLMNNMFRECAGTRSSDSPAFETGSQFTYYIKD